MQHSNNYKTIFASHLDLTLVDLPGSTKVPVGDQPPDIDEQTISLTMEYVKNLKSIILAIIPKNADMATSDSLKIGKLHSLVLDISISYIFTSYLLYCLFEFVVCGSQGKENVSSSYEA